MSTPLQERIAKQRTLNEKISKMESDLAAKARDLLDVYAKYKVDLAAAYIERDQAEKDLYDELQAEVHRKPQPVELRDLERQMSAMRLP